jgi:transposase
MTGGQTSTAYEQYVGVDIGAEGSSVSVLRPDRDTGSDAFDFEQTAHDMQWLQRRLLATGCAAERTLVVMEATGNYWIRLATSLHQAGFAVSVINPRQAHHFAQALLQRAKTDAVDAKMLAELAIRLQPAPWSAAPAVYEELQQRLNERDDLLNIR